MKEFNLSNEIIDNCVEADEYDNMIPSYKVKEFIRLLKEEFRQNTNYETIVVNEIINKFAGDKLV